MSDGKVYIAIAVISAVTAALRFAPFMMTSGKETPKTLSYLGKVLPYAIMGMLVVYCLKGVSFASAEEFAPELIASLAVVISYVKWKNTLLSIVGGTACYMLLVQLVF